MPSVKKIRVGTNLMLFCDKCQEITEHRFSKYIKDKKLKYEMWRCTDFPLTHLKKIIPDVTEQPRIHQKGTMTGGHIGRSIFGQTLKRGLGHGF